jgi:hypothetical protein
MITNDIELKCTQDRVAYFQSILAQIRVTATPEQFPFMASGYKAEIEKMQQELMEYLTRHVSQQPAA